MPLADTKPSWRDEFEEMWRANGGSRSRHVEKGSEPNVDGLTAGMFKEQLRILYGKTGAFQFKSALRALEQLGLVDESGRWARKWSRPIDGLLDDVLCAQIDKEVHRWAAPQRLMASFAEHEGWSQQKISYEISETNRIFHEKERANSVARACAMVAAETGLPAASFEAAIKIMERKYRSWMQRNESPSPEIHHQAKQADY